MTGHRSASWRSRVLGAAALAVVFAGGTRGAAAADEGFETIPPDEAAAIDELSRLATDLQDKRRDGQQGMLLRGVHPKSHGCVRAAFTVDADLDESLRVGLFATPGKTFDAWIRYSNASVLVEDDLKADNPAQPDARKNGSRGMALKVLDVEGELLLTDDGGANQDFLMINTPEFAVANVRDYLRLNRVLMLSARGDVAAPFFLPLQLAAQGKPLPGGDDPLFGDIFAGFDNGDLARTRRTLQVIQDIEGRIVRNPFQVQYFGAAPFAFGPDRVMKFSARPCVAQQQAFANGIAAGDPAPDYLRAALTETMQGDDDICLDFMVHVRNGSELGVAHIEDATTRWPTEDANYEQVARITVPAPQQPDDPDVVAQCEAMAFSPWQSLAAHRPLGGINRLRQQVYIESASHRGAAAFK